MRDGDRELIGFMIATIILFVFWQQDRTKFKYACRVMTDLELHLPDGIDIGSEAETNITRAMKGARIEAECREKKDRAGRANLYAESD